jgi:CBS domain containing-hemolysin-like protein
VGDFIALVLLLGLSAFFSGSETALISLSKGRADALARENRRGAKALHALKSEPQRMLIAILIGNNLVNIGAASLSTVIATRVFGNFGPGLAVGVLTVLILVFGEITPKSLSTRYSERSSLLVAPVILGLIRTVGPVVTVFQRITDALSNVATHGSEDPLVTESELISMIQFGEEEGTIEGSERELIERAFAFTDLVVEDVMTPRHKVLSVDGRQTLAESLQLLVDTPYSRIPLHEDDPDEILRILHLRDLLPEAAKGYAGDKSLSSLSREPNFVPDSQSVTETITAFRREQQHMAVVVDEHGTMRGVVTFEDLLEELVGEIYDERDEVPRTVEKLDQNRIILDGSAEIRLVEEFFNIDLSGKATDTVNRWILEQTGRIPSNGDTFQFEGLDVTVKSASRRRIGEVIIAQTIYAAENEKKVAS